MIGQPDNGDVQDQHEETDRRSNADDVRDGNIVQFFFALYNVEIVNTVC